MRKSNYINCQCKYRSAESAISYLSECYYNQAENVKTIWMLFQASTEGL